MPCNSHHGPQKSGAYECHDQKEGWFKRTSGLLADVDIEHHVQQGRQPDDAHHIVEMKIGTLEGFFDNFDDGQFGRSHIFRHLLLPGLLFEGCVLRLQFIGF